MTKDQLKGGSLSGTFLCSDGPTVFIRKEASLVTNREFGYQRWYSQLKKLQRYEILFPNLFPKVLTYGVKEDQAYFDIEYIHNTIPLHEFLMKTTDYELIDQTLANLLEVIAQIHTSYIIPSTTNPIELYVREEMENRINTCLVNSKFKEFLKWKYIRFNGVKIPQFSIEKFLKEAKFQYKDPTETLSHGKLTLENILIQPKTGKLILIDPYEENIIDSAIADYSQILQSSNSFYELYNSSQLILYDNCIEIKIPRSKGLEYFNGKFLEYLYENGHNLKMISLFEMSQFLRMMPFKMEIDQDRMILFYALASYLFHKYEN